MEEVMGLGASYWCHMCTQMVNPIMEAELKCPFCLGGFVEEMDATTRRFDESDITSDHALSLWAPILLGMMGNPRSRRRFRQHLLEENNADDGNDDGERHREGETEMDRELDSIIRRRRRSSTAVLQLLQGITAGIETPENDRGRDRERESLVLINPFNQTILLQGLNGSNQDQNLGHHNPFENLGHHNPFGSLGDYFVGPGLDLLLQHLAENDPNRYGTLPTRKEVVDALPTVKIEDNLQCSICLDEFDATTEAKEMPCKHKFHNACIVPWLELHSSCPICRFQLPADESKRDSEASRGVISNRSYGTHRGSGESESRFNFPWPLNTFSSSPRSHRNSLLPQSSPSASSSGGPGESSQADGN